MLSKLFGKKTKGKRTRKTPKKTSPASKRSPVLKRSKVKKKKSSFWKVFFKFSLTVCFLGLVSLGGIIAYYASFLPPIDQISMPKRPPNVSILASNGTLLANRGEMGGGSVKIEDLPPYVPNAFIAIEDRRFRSHFGIDPKGIIRAIYTNIRRGGVSMQGGSTLTQQLAKNIFLTQERTLSRKIQEAILAIWLEYKFSKDEILQFYMNRVYFGAGAYGIEAASRRYFNKPAVHLSLSEAAVLAGLVQSPSRLAPTRNPKGAQARALQVLSALEENKLAPKRMIDIARRKPAQTAKGVESATANYAADYVMDVLDDFIGTVEEDIIVYTTIDSSMQSLAENAVRQELNEKGAQYKVSQGALVSMTPDGAIKAIVGGKDYSQSQFNRATIARRQPGSSFKPFVYLTAIDYGVQPEDIREDAPIKVGKWKPENYSRTFFGPVTVRESLALSLNTVAVRLCLEVTPKNVVTTARRLGISSPLTPNASISLGTSEVTPLELTAAYSTFANGGQGIVPYVILEVSTPGNKVIYKKDSILSFGQVISPSSLSKMNDMLNAAFEIGTAKKANIPGWQAGGKTGTSQNWRDAWFIGFTGTLVTGVWVGNDDSSPTNRASGSNIPLNIWKRFMSEALKSMKPVPLPGGPWKKERLIIGEEKYDIGFEIIPPRTPISLKDSAPKKSLFEGLFGN